jgi:hypothetical protein
MAKTELHAVVDDALAVHPVAQPHLVKQVDRALLEHPGAHALLHVLTGAILEDYGVDSALVQEMRQDEPGGAGADNAHGSAQFACQRSGQSPQLMPGA